MTSYGREGDTHQDSNPSGGRERWRTPQDVRHASRDWSPERQNYHSRSRSASRHSQGDIDGGPYYDSAKRQKRSRSGSWDKYIQQQVQDSRTKRKSRYSTEGHEPAQHDYGSRSDDRSPARSVARTMYADMHDGQEDTYRYTRKSGHVADYYGEFDARKYKAKKHIASGSPSREVKRMKVASSITVTVTNPGVQKVARKPGVKSSVVSVNPSAVHAGSVHKVKKAKSDKIHKSEGKEKAKDSSKSKKAKLKDKKEKA